MFKKKSLSWENTSSTEAVTWKQNILQHLNPRIWFVIGNKKNRPFIRMILTDKCKQTAAGH